MDYIFSVSRISQISDAAIINNIIKEKKKLWKASSSSHNNLY